MANHSAPPDFSQFTCPAPLRDRPRIVLGHGGGVALSQDLIEHVFLPAFGNPVLNRLGDSSVLDLAPHLAGGGRLAFSTDSYVVRPLVFPGGSIGDLAVHGTVNDLAMSGARPLYLSAGFILEEGLAIAELVGIVARMAAAARAAGVAIVTGDTKVVERGHGDGVYINTAGIGVVPPGIDLGPDQVVPGLFTIDIPELRLDGPCLRSCCAPANGREWLRKDRREGPPRVTPPLAPGTEPTVIFGA